eukprot:TRINITY_DN5652_c0_g10_i2.p1 TRINITY_DN5652_c0_g10~~TRINITY_DN5652_c0_g10_i2.p1  ORF type:complete len:331 (+),score=60.28 TRINITY_DN5652_c0_g10_i2:823-1815(+)
MVTLKPPFRAPDMQSLYKRVLKGVYPKIPTSYSKDLASVIRALLQVSPQLRPACGNILRMPAVIERVEELVGEIKVDENVLLKTIRVPKKLLSLTNRLPKANYETSDKQSRHTTMGNYLPDIRKKIASCKAYAGKIRARKQLFGYNVKTEDNIKNVMRKDLASDSNLRYNKAFPEHEKLKREEEYDSDFEENELSTPKRRGNRSGARGIEKAHVDVQKENARNGIARLYKNKYLRQRRPVLEKVPSKYSNKSNMYEYKSTSITNSYIKSLINRRNPNITDNPSLITKKLLPKQSNIQLAPISHKVLHLSLIHICRCRRYAVCRSRWSPYH